MSSSITIEITYYFINVITSNLGTNLCDSANAAVLKAILEAL